MDFRKELAVPLVPIIVETAARLFLLEGKPWFAYFNAASVIITFSLWCTLTAISSPRKSPIPTDNEFSKKITNMRVNLTMVSVLGFIVFGFAAIGDAINIQFHGEESKISLRMTSMAAVFAISYAFISLSVIFLKRKEIGDIFYE